MRKVLWLIPFVCSVAYSQNDSNSQNYSKRICYDVDEITDKKEVMCEAAVLYGEDAFKGTQRAALRLRLEEKNGKIRAVELYFNLLGYKSCVGEGSTLHVIFENGENTKLISWNDFNCEGKNYFILGPLSNWSGEESPI